jgi:hypothetical protein
VRANFQIEIADDGRVGAEGLLNVGQGDGGDGVFPGFKRLNLRGKKSRRGLRGGDLSV